MAKRRGGKAKLKVVGGAVHSMKHGKKHSKKGGRKSGRRKRG